MAIQHQLQSPANSTQPPLGAKSSCPSAAQIPLAARHQASELLYQFPLGTSIFPDPMAICPVSVPATSVPAPAESYPRPIRPARHTKEHPRTRKPTSKAPVPMRQLRMQGMPALSKIPGPPRANNPPVSHFHSTPKKLPSTFRACDLRCLSSPPARSLLPDTSHTRRLNN